MDFDANLYNESNQFQYKDAEELIEEIKHESNDENFDIVIDIGCGTGNVTLMLNSMLNINQLFAIDVDKEMIAFAKEHHQKDNIKYLLQDLGLEWDQLRPELKALEGKVSLIFSNHVLHWISDKENATKNLFRLLSKSGRIYAHIYWISDPFIGLSGREKEIHEKEILKIPSKETQMNVWVNHFTNVGFKINKSKFEMRKSIFDETSYRKGILRLALLVRKQYFIEKNERKRNEAMIGITDEFNKRFLSVQTHQFINESNGKSMVEYRYGFFRFILEKHVN